MNTHRTRTTGYLLSRATTLAVLVAVMGCDTGRDTDEMAPPSAHPAPTEGAAADSRPDYTDRTTTSDQTRANDRDQSVTERSGEAATNAQFSLVDAAAAQIKPTSNGNAKGTVTFSAGKDNREMQVAVELEGLEPGPHGIHVHEVGDCSADDASSAGDHFNPYETPHGSPEAGEHHVGDMGNIEADDDGKVSTELTFRGLAFSGPASILQKAVVIHSGEDDLESQPSGDSGNPVGCGVIRIDRKVMAE